jgi:hypothetical protein
MLRVTSAAVFEAVGVRPVWRIGVAALPPSAWEVSTTISGSPARMLTWDALDRVAASNG